MLKIIINLYSCTYHTFIGKTYRAFVTHMLQIEFLQVMQKIQSAAQWQNWVTLRNITEVVVILLDVFLAHYSLLVKQITLRNILIIRSVSSVASSAEEVDGIDAKVRSSLTTETSFLISGVEFGLNQGCTHMYVNLLKSMYVYANNDINLLKTKHPNNKKP